MRFLRQQADFRSFRRKQNILTNGWSAAFASQKKR